MEFIPMSTLQLDYLAKRDPILAPIFEGVFAADQLPHPPEMRKPRAYIFNADPITKQGSHWFAMYTENNKCEVMDSYGLPLSWYSRSDAIDWIFDHFESINSNAKTLQEMNSQSCGQYALMYLKYRCRGKSMEDFVELFKKNDYVHNDHLVGELIKPYIHFTQKRVKAIFRLPDQQYNCKVCYIDI